ncbi:MULTISPECIES: AMP-binding protein [Streptomyces]|uniref:AMP-binding protein n=1 Tax=Streptomyces TaxID=1883 RepID=UPI0029B0420E|nr:AMP-binding protein [Streptomyces sp. ND04-05B]MDX3062209.1 AMP-binding protein [Streptomyces sp. ND04-05B]
MDQNRRGTVITHPSTTSRPAELAGAHPAGGAPTLDQVFSATARRYPTRIAVQDGWNQLTYARTDRQAGRLASALVRGGVQLGDPLIVHCGNHRHALVAQLAVLKAGGVCVPAPRTACRGGLPAAARQTMARAVLCSRSTYDEDVRGIPSLALDDPVTWRKIASAPAEPTLPRSTPEGAAYLLPGRGTDVTGDGRLVDHRSWLRSAADRSRRTGGAPPTVTIDEPPLSPVALAATWWACSTGGTLRTAPWQEDGTWPLTGGRESAAVLTPARYARGLATAAPVRGTPPPRGSAAGPGTVVLIGGPSSRDLVARHFRARPGTRLWAEFAPGGGAVPWTAQELHPHDAYRPYALGVGSPVPPVLLRVVGPGGAPLPHGRSGELVAIGPSGLPEDVHHSGWYGHWTPENTLDVTRRRPYADGAGPDVPIRLDEPADYAEMEVM